MYNTYSLREYALRDFFSFLFFLFLVQIIHSFILRVLGFSLKVSIEKNICRGFVPFFFFLDSLPFPKGQRS